MNTLRRAGAQVDRVLRLIEDWTMAALLAAAACLGLLQIVLRYGFSTGFDWIEAYLVMFIVYAALIGASVAVRRRLHVRLDVIVERFPARPRWLVDLATHLLCLGYTVAIWTFGLQFVLQVIRFGTVNIESDLPTWIHYICVPIGMTLMSLRYVQEIWVLLRAGPAMFEKAEPAEVEWAE